MSRRPKVSDNWRLNEAKALSVSTLNGQKSIHHTTKVTSYLFV